jgi:hypothetical protein
MQLVEAETPLKHWLQQWIDLNPLSGYQNVRERIARGILDTLPDDPALRVVEGQLYRGFLLNRQQVADIEAGQAVHIKPRPGDILESWTKNSHLAATHAQFVADEEAYHRSNSMEACVITMPAAHLDAVLDVGRFDPNSEYEGEVLVRPLPLILTKANVAILGYHGEVE